MAPADTAALMNIIGPKIVKMDTRFRAAIPVQERVAVTLRFRAAIPVQERVAVTLRC
jgi:hypothetical protein